jgi:hypothetical protein
MTLELAGTGLTSGRYRQNSCSYESFNVRKVGIAMRDVIGNFDHSRFPRCNELKLKQRVVFGLDYEVHKRSPALGGSLCGALSRRCR